MGADLMAGQIPPPPPGFVLGGAAPATPRAQQTPAAVSPRVSSALQGDPLQVIRSIAPDARITSARRTPERQAQLIADWERGGRQGVRPANNSRHLRGNAFDLAPGPGETMAQLERRVRDSGQPFAEIINEGDHVHVGWNGPEVGALDTLGAAAPAAAPSQVAAPVAPPPGFVIESPASGAEPISVEIDQGVQNVNGRIIGPNGEDLGDAASYEASQRQSQSDREARVTREADPMYQAAIARARGGSEAVPERLRALLAGQSLGLNDEILGASEYLFQGLENAGRQVSGQPIEISASMASQAARDSERDAQARYAAENPIENFALQTVGGLATPGLGAGGNYIAGAEGAARGIRAAQVGAGYGALSGLANGTGDLVERAPSAVAGGLVGAGTGAIGQRVVDRLGAGVGAVRPASAARRLSREGVDLTPGQMLSEVPVIGNVARSLEEGASTIPFVGSPIAGARQQSVETFNRAAINRVLEPLNETLPRNVKPGYASVEAAQQRVSAAYDRALDGVELRPDQDLYDDLGRSINSAVEGSGATGAKQVSSEISDRVFRVLQDFDDPITGQQFKALESEFGNLARNAMESTDGATRAVGRAYQSVNDGLRAMLERQNPEAASSLRQANSAYSRLMRVEDAAASTATQANDGVFTPTQLGQAVGRRGSRRASARGDSLMQDLAVDGRNIIPSRVGDSGTATRGAITGLVAGVATGTPVAGALAAPVIATSIAYSRPAQAALNALYRATDSQTATSHLQQLARLAQRDPALIPYYQGAVERVLSLAQTQSQATPPAQSAAPVPTPVQ